MPPPRRPPRTGPGARRTARSARGRAAGPRRRAARCRSSGRSASRRRRPVERADTVAVQSVRDVPAGDLVGQSRGGRCGYGDVGEAHDPVLSPSGNQRGSGGAKTTITRRSSVTSTNRCGTCGRDVGDRAGLDRRPRAVDVEDGPAGDDDVDLVDVVRRLGVVVPGRRGEQARGTAPARAGPRGTSRRRARREARRDRRPSGRSRRRPGRAARRAGRRTSRPLPAAHVAPPGR